MQNAITEIDSEMQYQVSAMAENLATSASFKEERGCGELATPSSPS